MSTQAQIEANRRNAQLSTGPRTDQGKRISSMNAFQSGIDPETPVVFGESREDFVLLQTQLYDSHAPATPDERSLVDKMLRNEWYLRRFFRVDAQLWELHSMESQRGTGYELAEGFRKNDASFNRFWRRQQTCEKNLVDARAELARLVRQRLADTPAPAPQDEITPATPPQPPAPTPQSPNLASFFRSPETGELTDQGFDVLAGLLLMSPTKTRNEELPEPETDPSGPREDKTEDEN